MKLSNVTIAQATLTVSLLSMRWSSPEVVPIDHTFVHSGLTRVYPLSTCSVQIEKQNNFVVQHDPLLGHKSHVCLL